MDFISVRFYVILVMITSRRFNEKEDNKNHHNCRESSRYRIFLYSL